MRKIFVSFWVAMMFISPVAAQTSTTATSTRTHGLYNLRIDLKTLRTALQNATSSEEREQAWENFKTLVASTTEQFRRDVESEREALQGRIKEKRQKLEEGLNRIKSESKRRTVEQIDANFDALNTKRTASFDEVLNKLHAILGKISLRADDLAKTGTNVDTVRTAVADAESAINVARIAVTAQTGQTYKIEVTTETQLKAAVGKTRSALAHDLNQVFTIVKSAREAARHAAQALRVLTGENAATSTPPASTSTATSS